MGDANERKCRIGGQRVGHNVLNLPDGARLPGGDLQFDGEPAQTL